MRRSLLIVSITLALLLVMIQMRPVVCKKDINFDKLEAEWLAEDEADDEDAPFVWKKGKDGPKKMPNPHMPKQEMVFARVKSTDKEVTEKLGVQWSQLLKSNAIDVNVFAVEKDTLLFVIQKGTPQMISTVQSFVLQQPETVHFEWKQQKSFPKTKEL